MPADWLSFHLFYHADRDRLLLELVRPLVGALAERGEIDRFFFVRFALGGPHVRLRLRPVPGRADEAAAAVAAAAAGFFERWPSTDSRDEEAIRRTNRTILATDPSESDDSAYPDNSFQVFPFRPEVDRYGGPDLLPHSLDFFGLSSLYALDFLAAHGGEPWSRRSPLVFRMLARLALGLARSAGELVDLLGYPASSWGEPMAGIVAGGDRVFEQNREAFCRMLRVEAEALDESPTIQTVQARRLAWEIRGAVLPARRTIATSHLHMTVNRLGLSNPEEVYLGRMLWRAATALAESEPAFWEALDARLAEQAEP